MNIPALTIEGYETAAPRIELSLDELREAFSGIAPGKRPGIDRVTKELYAHDLEAGLSRLRETLSQGYEPQPVLRHHLRKHGGGSRPIAFLCIDDKIVQRAILRRVQKRFDGVLHERSFARLGGGPTVAADQLFLDLLKRQPPAILQLDVARCFETLRHKDLVSMLSKRLARPELDIIRAILKQPILVESQEATEDDAEVPLIETVRDVGIEQGMPLSTFLANVYLHVALDEWLENRCDAVDTWVRFVDDVVVLLGPDADPSDVQQQVATQLGDFGLTLKENKCRVVRDFGPAWIDTREPGSVDVYGGIDFVGTKFRPARTRSGSYFVETYRDTANSSPDERE